jgi:hypothetical protein
MAVLFVNLLKRRFNSFLIHIEDKYPTSRSCARGSDTRAHRAGTYYCHGFD